MTKLLDLHVYSFLVFKLLSQCITFLTALARTNLTCPVFALIMTRDDASNPISRRAALVATHAPTQRTPRRPLLCNAWCVSTPRPSPPASSAPSRPTPPPTEAYPLCPSTVAPAAAAARATRARRGARARPPGTRAARARDGNIARVLHAARPSRRRVPRDRGRPPPARRFGAPRAEARTGIPESAPGRSAPDRSFLHDGFSRQ